MEERSAVVSLELAECEREPIHIPGQIQPHGFLLAAPGTDAPISHASENARTLAGRGAAALGRTWEEALGPTAAAALRRGLRDAAGETPPFTLLKSWPLPHELRPPAEQPAVEDGAGAPPAPPTLAPVELVAHARGGFVIVEAEERLDDTPADAGTLAAELSPLLTRLSETSTLAEVHALAAEELRRLSGYDRALIYQFDEEWHGTVIAESRNDTLPSYLDHRFPASDIPRQARELYLVHRNRFIADAHARPVALLAVSADLPPLDLSLSALRGVSPFHLEYMRNMGTGSSFSLAIILEGRLWGLLSCHSATPRRLPPARRAVCDLLARIYSLQLGAHEQSRRLARQVELRRVLSRLVARLAGEEDFVAGLDATDLLELTGASGAAVLRGDDVAAFGATPPAAILRDLREWAAPLCEDGCFQTPELASLRPDLANYVGVAAGLLAISISPDDRTYLFWFRGEFVRTVRWGGDPHKALSPGPAGPRLHPRKSFATWQQTVRGLAAPWDRAEEESAMEFRRELIDIVLKQAAAKARLLGEVQRMNKELEAFTYTVSHDLRAPFRHVRGYAELLQMEKAMMLDEDGRHLLERILKSSAYAGELVDTLLAFSRMNLTPLAKKPVPLGDLVRRARGHAMVQAHNRSIEWRIPEELPIVEGDASLLLLAVQNIFENAVKYTCKRDHAVIEVTCEQTPREWVLAIRDNGAGFDMRYVDKLFGVFQRLHSVQQFGGLGIGLATVRRIIERHGGRTWAVGEPDVGSTFFLSLPVAAAVDDAAAGTTSAPTHGVIRAPASASPVSVSRDSLPPAPAVLA